MTKVVSSRTRPATTPESSSSRLRDALGTQYAHDGTPACAYRRSRSATSAAVARVSSTATRVITLFSGSQAGKVAATDAAVSLTCAPGDVRASARHDASSVPSPGSDVELTRQPAECWHRWTGSPTRARGRSLGKLEAVVGKLGPGARRRRPRSRTRRGLGRAGHAPPLHPGRRRWHAGRVVARRGDAR